jgi:phospholipase/carboxylesterase
VDEAEDLMVLVPALLQSLEVLGFVARHLNPADLYELMGAIGEPEVALAEARPRLETWPDRIADLRTALQTASDQVLTSFGRLREAAGQGNGIRLAYRALRGLPLAEEALYPFAAQLAPISRYFLQNGLRGDAGLLERLAQGVGRDDVGVAHFHNEAGSRGGFSLYVPETYSPDVAAPLVVALHGGGGNGRGFLWSWLRDARSRGAILIAPTAVGDTWALSGHDRDTPNLMRMLAFVTERWNVDPTRVLLTGMSDGGTFSYVSGLEPRSPFTHLAPIAAAFHPMLAQMADPERLTGLPIFIGHGALDWMFPVDMAREACGALSAAGAEVTYREIADLSHTYPRELNAAILDWLSQPRP